MLFVPGKKTNMTNRRKIRLYWEQQNHKHKSKRILKGEVINILLLGRPVESLHNLGENEKSNKPLYLQEKCQKQQYSPSNLEERIEMVGRRAPKVSGSITAHLNITVQG